MAYSLSPCLKSRYFITGTNRPLAGGLLYTYLAGTTTNAATYSDNLGTPNTNPVVLDADGQCNLFLDDNVSYRIILKNSAGVTQFDQDRVASISSAQVAALAVTVAATAADVVTTAASRDASLAYSILSAAARDAALIQAGVYATEPLGRAAVADGVAFKVQGSGDVAAYEYRRVDASSSTLIATYPSSAALSFVDRSTEYFVYGGQALEAIVDSAGRSLAAWLADGILRAKFGLQVDSTSPITLTFDTATGLTTVSLTTARLETAEQYIGANKVIGGLTDANLRAYLAMFEDGRTYIPKLLVDTLTSTGVITATAVTLSGVDLATMLTPETVDQYIGNNKVIGSLTDSLRRAYLAMFEDGRTYIPKLTVDTLTVGGATVNSAVNSVHQSDFVIYGDSLSIPGGSSGFSQAFAALYPTRATYIQGVSGQQSWDIAARVGMGVTCSVAGGVIPTSGSVTLSGWSGSTTVYGVLGSANAGIYAANARLYGVAGVLSVDATNTHTFTPTSYPAATRPVPAACPLQITGQTVYGTTDTSSSLTLDVQNSAIAILWLGRNDFRYAGYSQAATLANIAAAYAQLKNVYGRVLVLGTINGEYDLTAARSPAVGASPSDAESQRRLDANAALRAALAQTYGDNYLGMQEALELAGYAGSWTISGTTYQILNNTLLPDGVHPTGNQSIIAGIVQSRITTKGW